MKWLSHHSMTLKTISLYLLLLWDTVQEDILPVGGYWEHPEEAAAQWCLQWDVTTDQKKNVVKLVIKQGVVHKAGSALHPGSYGMTCSLKTAAFSERVAASHAVQKLIDCCSSGVSHYPECNLGKKYRVTGWRLGTPSLVPTARSKALLSRCTWPHTCMTVILPFAFEPSGDSRPKDSFAPAWKALAAIEMRNL